MSVTKQAEQEIYLIAQESNDGDVIANVSKLKYVIT